MVDCCLWLVVNWDVGFGCGLRVGAMEAAGRKRGLVLSAMVLSKVRGVERWCWHTFTLELRFAKLRALYVFFFLFATGVQLIMIACYTFKATKPALLKHNEFDANN